MKRILIEEIIWKGVYRGAIHAFLLFFDHYQPSTITEVLIPFQSNYEPILSGIGTIAMYLLLIVIVTSDFMKHIGNAIWKQTHYLAFPTWFLYGNRINVRMGERDVFGKFSIATWFDMYMVLKRSKKRSNVVREVRG